MRAICSCRFDLHCASKNHTDVAQYSFDADRPILIIMAGNSYSV